MGKPANFDISLYNRQTNIYRSRKFCSSTYWNVVISVHCGKEWGLWGHTWEMLGPGGKFQNLEENHDFFFFFCTSKQINCRNFGARFTRKKHFLHLCSCDLQRMVSVQLVTKKILLFHEIQFWKSLSMYKWILRISFNVFILYPSFSTNPVPDTILCHAIHV